jgi:hypothetical protein
MPEIRSIQFFVTESDHEWLEDEKGDKTWKAYFLDLARRDRERRRF